LYDTYVNMAPKDPHAILDAFWAAIHPLKPTSSDAEFEKYASFVHPEAKLYFQGPTKPPFIGRQGAIESIKSLLTFWEHVERRVVARTVSADGKTAMTEMDSHLIIMGEPVEHFPELEVAEFDDDGLVVGYRLYCDPQPIMDIIVAKTAAQQPAT